MADGNVGSDSFYVELGQRIRRFRKAKEITQETLAEKVGLTRTSLTNIEKGRQRIFAHTLAQIASTLGASANDLVPQGENRLEAALLQRSASERAWIEAALQPKRRQK